MSLNHRLAEHDPNRNSIQWQAERELLPPFLVVAFFWVVFLLFLYLPQIWMLCLITIQAV